MKRLLVILISLILIPILAQFGVQIANNCIAMEVEKEIKSLPLPERTNYIESISAAEKLVGNGNGMQYFGAMLIKSELSLEELDTYYSVYRENNWEYVVGYQTDGVIMDENWIVGDLGFKSDIDSDDYYIVYSWGDTDVDFLSWFDIRGR
ncbi:MAG: hypothetical protein IJX57_00090 [Clostridia bacterium]|nr:hypothetical protein [Clostridia bacterium]